MWLSAGLGILLGAAAHTALLAVDNTCRPARKTTLIGAAVAGGIGFSMTLGGGTALAVREDRYRANTRDRMAMAWSGLGAAALMQLMLGTARATVKIACSD